MSAVFSNYAHYYDLLYQQKDYASEALFVSNLLRKVGSTADSSGSMLELGCGTGRHAEHFARMGYYVHGVDYSAEMVAIAQQRVPQDMTGNLTFDEGDVRTFQVDRMFDTVISLFHVVSYQTENQDILAMFRTAARQLKRGGFFIFDCWYGPAVLTDRPTVRVKKIFDHQLNVLCISEPTMYQNENRVDVKYTIYATNKTENEPIETFEEMHRMRYFFIPELKMFLETVGFKIHDTTCMVSGGCLSTNTWFATIVAVRI